MIDFSKVSKEVSDLFNEISDLNYLFLRLQFIYQVQLYERESVIIFDEVQLQPYARPSVKSTMVFRTTRYTSLPGRRQRQRIIHVK